MTEAAEQNDKTPEAVDWMDGPVSPRVYEPYPGAFDDVLGHVSNSPILIDALKAILKLAALDDEIGNASAVVMSRMADIYQHADSALAAADTS